MFKKYINKFIIFIHLFVTIILLIKYSINNNCYNYELIPGNLFITEKSKSSWQIISSKLYNKNTLPNISEMKFLNINNYLQDDYPIFKGHIMLLDKEDKEDKEDIFAIFNNFPIQQFYYDFIFYFDKYVDLNNEIYKIDINQGLLSLKFLNKCSNNTVLYEKDNKCMIKDTYYYNINMFLQDFFNEKIELPKYCYNNNILYIMLYIIFIIMILISIFIFSIIYYFKKKKMKFHNNEYIPLI